MKTPIKQILFTLVATMMAFGNGIYAQATGNGNVIVQEYELSGFDKISTGGAFKVELVTSDHHFVHIETDENLFDNIEVKVRKGKLSLESKNIRKYTRLQVTVGLPSLVGLETSGAAKISGKNTFKGEHLILNSSGASEVKLDLDYGHIETTLSGASKAILTGQAGHHQVQSSGASKLTADELLTATTIVRASGASKAKVWAAETLEATTSGAASVNTAKIPPVFISNGNRTTMSSGGDVSGSRDATRISLGNVKVEVIDGDSITMVVAGRSISVDDKGNVNVKRTKPRKFNGHWAGVELGFNGLLTPDFNMNYPKQDAYLDLRMEKSINVNVNFYEQNIRLNKAGNVGLVSGLGLSWNNYRFANNVFITPDSLELKGYYMEGISTRKSKLTNLYLTVPLIFEVQTKGKRTVEKMHFAAGVIGGWRVRTHTKIFYNEPNAEFRLRDPESGQLLPLVMKSPGGSGRIIDKNHDSFHMRPFKLDATVRAGWGIINLYANYSLTSLFVTDRGPELYPFSVGICLTGW